MTLKRTGYGIFEVGLEGVRRESEELVLLLILEKPVSQMELLKVDIERRHFYFHFLI